MGNSLDQEVPEIAKEIMSEERRAALEADDPFNVLFERAVYNSPSYTIRGGTREIIRGVIAKGLGLR
jgi:hypothetical protein